MNSGTFLLSGNQLSAGHFFRLPACVRFYGLIAMCGMTAGIVGGCASNGKVAARSPYTGVKIGAAIYDARTRNFEKPWPFGDALGPGENFN
jgi:hypothetical protein